MKLKKLLARIMVFVFSLNLIQINVNAEENKLSSEDNVVVTENEKNRKEETAEGSTVKKTLAKAADVAKSGIKSAYQLAKTGIKYAAVGCCVAFGFYTFKNVKHKTKHLIKNMRKKSKSDSCSSYRSSSDDSSVCSIINMNSTNNFTYQRSGLRNSSFIDTRRYNNGGNLTKSTSLGYIALQQNNNFNDEVKSPLII